jgi:hypothetical protein
VKYKSDFSATTQNEGDVRIDGQVVPEKDIFRCLGSMLQKDRDIDEDVSHKIKPVKVASSFWCLVVVGQNPPTNCHTPFRGSRNEASIHVPRMFNSHV